LIQKISKSFEHKLSSGGWAWERRAK